MRYIGFFVLLAISALKVYAQRDLPLETVVQTGHYESIEVLKFSKDGNYLVSGSSDNTVKLWEINTGREIRTYSGSTFAIRELDISPDNKWLVTINRDSTAWIWDVETGEVVKKLFAKDEVINSALFSKDGNVIYTGGKNYNITAWDRSKGTILWRQEGVKIGCYSGNCKVDLALSKDGNRLLTGISNYSAILWDLKKHTEITRVKASRSSCSSCMTNVDFGPDDKSFITAVGRDSVKVWDSEGKELRRFHSGRGFSEVSVQPNGKYFASYEYRELSVVNYITGTTFYKDDQYLGGTNTAVFSTKGDVLAVAGNNRSIGILRMSDMKPKVELTGVVNQFVDSLSSNIRYWVSSKNAQQISPDGKIVAKGRIGNIVRLWDITTGRTLRDLEGHSGPVISLSFSPDGKYLASASGDETARIWEVVSGKQVKLLKYHNDIIFSIKYNHDGTKLTTTSWDGLVVIWDVESGKALSRYKPHTEGSPYAANLTPNGLYLVSAGLDNTFLMTEPDTGKPVKEFIGHNYQIPDIEFSPDGKYMLSGSFDGLAKLWDINTTYQVSRFSGHKRAIYDVAYSHTGQWIATASGDKTAKIWEAQTGKLVATLMGHKGAVTSIDFVPGDQQVLTGSRDGTSKLWDIKTEKELYTHVFTGEKDWLVKVPSGHFYATDGARKSVFFVRGTESYDIERFFDDYYKPALLENLAAPRSRDGNEINLLDKLEQFPPPSIEILAPKPPYPNDKETMDLMFRILNNGGGIDEIKVTHNGKRIIDDRSDLEKVQKSGKSVVKLYQVALVPGVNDIRVSAFSKGRIESKVEKVEWVLEGDVPLGSCHIFAIGINEYQNPRLNLNYAEADAKAFVNELKKDGKRLYDEIFVHQLINEEATKENILLTVRELQASIGPNDVFYFFYAGHGSLVENVFYFIPTEVTRLYDKEALESGAISAEIFRNELKNIKALKQVMVLDACHSGGSTEILAERGAAEEKALAQLSRSAGVHVLAAAGSDQTAAEFTELGHGLFTFMILEALSGKADGAPMDNKVTVYELKSFLDDQVPDYSQKYKGSPQYPSTFSRGNDFPLTLGKKKDN